MIEVFKHDKDAIVPTRNNLTDAGLDLYALYTVFIPYGETVLLRTGISINIPEGFVGKIEDRSGLASQGLRTGAGVVDHGYSGEIRVVMHNLNYGNDTDVDNKIGTFGKWFKKGDKVAQILLYKIDTTGVMEVKNLWNSERGDKGFGSSGK